MSAAILEPLSASGYRLNGEVTLRQLPALLPQIDLLAKHSGQEVSVSLSHLTQADSAVIALMSAWQRSARRARINLRFTNVPERIVRIAGAYGVSALAGGQ